MANFPDLLMAVPVFFAGAFDLIKLLDLLQGQSSPCLIVLQVFIEFPARMGPAA